MAVGNPKSLLPRLKPGWTAPSKRTGASGKLYSLGTCARELKLASASPVKLVALWMIVAESD